MFFYRWQSANDTSGTFQLKGIIKCEANLYITPLAYVKQYIIGRPFALLFDLNYLSVTMSFSLTFRTIAVVRTEIWRSIV